MNLSQTVPPIASMAKPERTTSVSGLKRASNCFIRFKILCSQRDHLKTVSHA